jgi:hypothetical protein
MTYHDFRFAEQVKTAIVSVVLSEEDLPHVSVHQKSSAHHAR